MPGKNFRNQTDRRIWVSLTVRQGDEPWAGTPHEVDNRPAEAGKDSFITYGDDSNPYVDAIEATFDANFMDGVTKVEAEHQRGGPNDSAMNTNDTVTMSLDGDGKIALAFSNG